MGRTARIGVALVVALLVSSIATPALARARFPRHIDPRSWELPEHMTWADYRPVPNTNWNEPSSKPPKTLRAALILGDFTDYKMRVAQSTVDPTGDRGLGVDDPAEYWRDYLFYDTDPNAPHHGHTVNEYWLENSYGLLGVDAAAFGPYTMDGKLYEYGVTEYGGAESCPDGPDGCSGNFDTELVEKSLTDVTAATAQNGEFDFRFLLHAGYAESGMWLNYGLAMFPNKEAVTDKFGPPEPDHPNWADTRYVDWTSFFAAQGIWSHAIPGALSTQGESDGGSTYAHELSHILGVLDNYNNPYDPAPKRSYSGPWDMMSRGTFNGPGGPWSRDQIPPTQGGTMGSHHMLRNKVRMGFTPPAEVFQVSRGALDAAGIVRVDLLQRESPPALDDPLLFSGLRVVLDEDASECDYSKPKCDGGDYDFYDMEVVNRQGFDSFLPDHGVIIAKTKAADTMPFLWVIDAHPKDLKAADYISAATGKKVPYTVGDYRQLSDAAFHAGTAPRTRNIYTDKVNELRFFILSREKTEDGRMTYSVAAESLRAPDIPREPEVVRTSRGKLRRGTVMKQIFEVTNTGARDAVYKLKVTRKGAVKTRILNNLVYVAAGATEEVIVWAKRTGSSGKVGLKAVLQ